MKLQHNLGGLEGLGPVDFERRVFVQEWEKGVFAIHVAMMGLGIWTWTELRKGAESMNPFDYFRLRYYEKWLGGITQYLIGQGYFTQDEFEERVEAFLADPDASFPVANGNGAVTEKIVEYLWAGDSPQRDGGEDPVFETSDSVTVRHELPWDHTRLPGYLKGRAGTVVRRYPGAYQQPPTGPSQSTPIEPVYLVRFETQELFGDLAEPGTAIYADLWQSYLER